MTERTFAAPTSVTDRSMELAVAPALTPRGVEPNPTFFQGFAAHPQVVARGLAVLAEITATRYFQPVPGIAERDPILSAHGDRLRAECFSACNGVYARFDLLQSGLDGVEIARGTTNVDLSAPTRTALNGVGATDLMHVRVGGDGLTLASPAHAHVERPVDMPPRWVPALGTVAVLHRALHPLFELDAAASRGFLGSLPTAMTAGRGGWLTPDAHGARLQPRRRGSAVRVAGLHRLTALRRLIPHVRGMVVSGADGDDSAVVFDVLLPDARLVVGLTPGTQRGHAAEGALLPALAGRDAKTDADLLAALLAFEPVIDVDRLARDAGLPVERVDDAVGVLAAQGRVGWDIALQAHFHRELPTDEARVEREHPRLRNARRLVASGAVSNAPDGWVVRSGERSYTVRDDDRAGPGRCTCTWALQSAGSRGPCKHVLAVQMARAASPTTGAR